jgi:hypothetical protein
MKLTENRPNEVSMNNHTYGVQAKIIYRLHNAQVAHTKVSETSALLQGRCGTTELVDA